jgi:hypothetical protein
MTRLGARGLLLSVALALGCDDGSAGDDDDGAGSSSGSGGLAPCDEQPVLTYDTFGRGFLSTYCDGCHGSAVVERQGAPASVVFDTHEQALALGDRILARAAPTDGSEPTMPPVGGVTEADRERLLVWLGCWE